MLTAQHLNDPRGGQGNIYDLFFQGLEDRGSIWDPFALNNKPKDKGPVYVGPNYAALRAANKANAERQAPLMQQNFQNSLGDVMTNIDFGKQQAKDAEDLANANKLKADNNQRTVAADMWYHNQQDSQNMYRSFKNDMNNTYGSLHTMANKLTEKVDDQGDSDVLMNLKQGLLQNSQSYTSDMNQIHQALDENNMSAYQQLRDIERQYASAMVDYATSFFGTQASYYDRSLINANGELTDAGWDWAKNFLSLINNGNNQWDVDYSNLISQTGMTMDEYRSMLADLKNSHTPLLSIDDLGMVRSIDETTDSMRKKSPTHSTELSKAGKYGGNQLYYTDTQTKRYG